MSGGTGPRHVERRRVPPPRRWSAPTTATGGAGFAPDRARIVLDNADPDRQTLLFWYPGVIANAISYVQSAVKIESGAKSALDPHQAAVVAPYVAADLPRLDLRVPNITTVEPERTLWDKVVILHGQRRWWEPVHRSPAVFSLVTGRDSLLLSRLASLSRP